MQIQSIPVSAIRRSPSNPRRTFREEYIAELTASVKDKGVISPILVRPAPAPTEKGITHELVYGECRWRASVAAELKTVPAMVRELDDRAVLEIQIIENDKREDVHPIEQSDAYRRLIDEHAYTVEDLAAKTGRSVVYVQHRLALRDLCAEGRAALDEGKLTLGVALAIARFPADRQRVAVLKLVVDETSPHHREVATLRQARAILAAEVATNLKEAPFGLDDKTFQVGACTSCPKRTITQRELFDLGKGDLCTDTACYKAKVDVHWARLKTRGANTLSPKEASKVFDKWGGDRPTFRSGYAAASETAYHDGKNTPYKALVDPSKIMLARAPSGAIVELIPRSAIPVQRSAAAAKKAAGPSKHELEADLRRREQRLVGEKIADVYGSVRATGPLLQALLVAAQRALARELTYQMEGVAKRRGLDRQKIQEQKFEMGLFAEMVSVAVDSRFDKAAGVEFCKAAGVDLAAIKRAAKKSQEKAEIERKARATAKAKKTMKKPKPAAKPATVVTTKKLKVNSK